MKKLVLLLAMALMTFVVGAQNLEVEGSLSIPIVRSYEVGASLNTEYLVFGASYNHYKTFDNFMGGIGVNIYDNCAGFVLEGGLRAGLGNEKFSGEIYFKFNMALDVRDKIDLIIYPRYSVNVLGNYPEIRLGVSYSFGK